MNDEHKDITFDLYGDEIGRVQLVQHWGDDTTVVRSARVSFGADKQGAELSSRDEKLINYLVTHRHTSTLEHCGATFKFVVPLFVRSQHHRHRTWSYNEISRRYTDLDIKFYEPQDFRTQHKANRQASNVDELIDPAIEWKHPEMSVRVKSPASALVRKHNAESLKLFDDLLAAGVCREQARGVLPQNMYTEYYGSVNLSNLIKFIDLRSHEGAQWEIQKVAEACLNIAKILWPVTIEAYISNK